MGNVFVVYRVMPDSPESVESVRERVVNVLRSSGVEVMDVKEEPIAFGLKAILVGVKMEDKGGVVDEVEEKIRSVEGVESVSVDQMTLI